MEALLERMGRLSDRVLALVLPTAEAGACVGPLEYCGCMCGYGSCGNPPNQEYCYKFYFNCLGGCSPACDQYC